MDEEVEIRRDRESLRELEGGIKGRGRERGIKGKR